MDSDFLKNFDLFAAQNNQTADKPGESSAARATSTAAEADFWDALAGIRPGGTGAAGSGSSTTNNPLGSFASFPPMSNTPTTTAASSASNPNHNPQYRPQPHQNAGISKRVLPTRGPPDGGGAAVKDRHDKKRHKMDPDAATVDSADYWLQFDEEEGEPNVGSGTFEIDFSKGQSLPMPTYNNLVRPGTRLAPLPNTPGLGSGLYANQLFQGDDFIDDGALDNALSDDEEALESMNLGEQLSSSNVDTAPPSEVPPREGLYSTPLSWEKPAPGLTKMNPMFMLGAPMLDPEQRRLLAIALNSGGSSADMGMGGSGFGFGPGGFPESEPSSMGHLGSNTETPSRSDMLDDDMQKSKGKGKAPDFGDPSDFLGGIPQRPAKPMRHASKVSIATSATSSKTKDKGKGGDRTAHNDIERKYRTNLKDKIAELRDAVPSLRSIPEEGEEDEDDDETSRSAPKVSKGTILMKATDYIHQLEKRNRAIQKQHQDLSRRLQAFEQLLTAVAEQPFAANHSRSLFDPRGFC